MCQYFSFKEINPGMQSKRGYVFSQQVYDAFLAAFDDRNPIHVDNVYARKWGFSGFVMHGAILNGFLSHFVGMHFPGYLGFTLSVDVRYSAPSFLGDQIEIRAEVDQKVESQRVIVLKIDFFNETQKKTVGCGRVQVRVR